LGGSQLQANPGKNFARPHLNAKKLDVTCVPDTLATVGSKQKHCCLGQPGQKARSYLKNNQRKIELAFLSLYHHHTHMQKKQLCGLEMFNKLKILLIK
jgi:hypothetical protein